MVELGLAIISILLVVALLSALLPRRLRDERLERRKSRGDSHLDGFAGTCGCSLWALGKIRSTRKIRGHSR